MSVLPRPGRELVSRALKGDQVLAAPDAATRAAYQARAAGEPALRAAAAEGKMSDEQVPAA